MTEDKRLRLQQSIPDDIHSTLSKVFVASPHKDMSSFLEHVLERGLRSIRVDHAKSSMISRRLEEIRANGKRGRKLDVFVDYKFADEANKLKELIEREYGRKGRVYREAIYRYLKEEGHIDL